MNKRAQPASIPHAARDHVDDNELVNAARAGDRDAFRTLFQRYHRRAYSLAYGVVHNADDALDVVQDAFIKAHRYLDKFEGTSSFYTWLYRIVMNLAIDHLRKHRKSRVVDFSDQTVTEDDAAVGDQDLLPRILGGHPGRALADKQIRIRIEAALAELSENHRAVLVMRELEGLSYEEMATVMGCSKGTIMSRLFHARKNMQRRLLDLIDHPSPELLKELGMQPANDGGGGGDGVPGDGVPAATPAPTDVPAAPPIARAAKSPPEGPVTPLRDDDLMQLADDELDAASAAEVERALAQPEHASARDRLAAVRELGELVRGHLELRADEVEDRLGAMWAEVDKQLDLVAAPAALAPPPVIARPGAWARFATWLSGHRTHLATGLVSAGAVAAVMTLVTPGGKDRVITRTVNITPPTPPIVQVALKREAPQVESLDTPGGTGTVFTFEDDEGGTAVILVTPNDVEGI